MKRAFFVVITIGITFVVSIGLDRVSGIYLNRWGYFMALTPSLTEIHDSREYRMTAHVSSQGLRNAWVRTPKPRSVFRVLALGDSFTFGEGVEDDETWEEVLNKKMATSSASVEIINAGKPGAGVTEVRQICRAYADRFDIDAFIVGVYADDLAQAAYIEEKHNTNLLSALVSDTWQILSRLNMRVIGFVRWPGAKPGDTVVLSEENKRQVAASLKKNPTILLSVPEPFRKDFIDGMINPALFINAIRVPEQFTYVLDPTAFGFALHALKTRLAFLQERCTTNKPVFIVYIPSSDQVSQEYHPFRQAFGFYMDPALTVFDIDTPIKKMIQSFGYRYVSVLPSFRETGCPNCYYPYDGHLTAVGQQALAEYLYEHLIPYIKR